MAIYKELVKKVSVPADKKIKQKAYLMSTEQKKGHVISRNSAVSAV